MSTQFTKLPVCNTITNITATASLYEQFVLYGIQRGADWALTTDHVTGDDTDITFSITTAGQVQYTSTDQAGFVSNNIRFRAWCISF